MENNGLFIKMSLFDVLVIGLMCLGVVFMFFSFRDKVLRSSVDVEYVKGDSSNNVGVGKILVDVGGAVVSPGVYELDVESRLKDALVAAGGLSESADREWVGRVLNMAEKVSDGEKIFIPEILKNQNIESSKQTQNSNLININSASQSQLDGLWGIGEARALAIIEGRPYKNTEELLTRKIIPQNVFDANKEKLSVY